MSCLAKLFERLAHHRLTWFLKVNDLLPHVQTAFCPHLDAEESLVDLLSYGKLHSGNVSGCSEHV